MARSVKVSTVFLFCLAVGPWGPHGFAAEWVTVGQPAHDNCVVNGMRAVSACFSSFCRSQLPNKLHLDVEGSDAEVAPAVRTQILQAIFKEFLPHAIYWRGAPEYRAKADGWPFTYGWNHSTARALIARTDLTAPDTPPGVEKYLVVYRLRDPFRDPLSTPSVRPAVLLAWQGRDGNLAFSRLGMKFADNRTHQGPPTNPGAFVDEQNKLKAQGFTLRGSFEVASETRQVYDERYLAVATETYEFWADGKGRSELLGRAELYRHLNYSYNPDSNLYKLLTVGLTGLLGNGPLFTPEEFARPTTRRGALIPGL